MRRNASILANMGHRSPEMAYDTSKRVNVDLSPAA